jgi:predicted phosphoribosyltransferase
MTAPRLPFRDRREAGRVLAEALLPVRGRPGLIVLALPRGGVPVGHEVALALEAPLDVLVVRKLGVPGQEEYAMGALASPGVRVLTSVARMVPDIAIERVVRKEQAELERRERLYRGDRPMPSLAGRSVVLVDDGLATGATMRAAAQAVRAQKPEWLCVAVPVGAPDSCDSLEGLADAVVCPAMPDPFRAVSLWYQSFPQTDDDEVRELLDAAARRCAEAAHPH